VEDAAEAILALELGPCVVLGQGLGGVNAYQLAARHPRLVKGLVIEDAGAVCQDDLTWAAKWPARWPTYAALKQFLAGAGLANDTYYSESLCEFEDGWGFRFRGRDMCLSQESLNGDWSADWKASTCPALLLRGEQSQSPSAEHAREMVAVRPHTRLVEFAGVGGNLHAADPERYATEVRVFLDHLDEL
jgi:esterase